MTTPNQPLPSTVDTLVGVGAFQIGGSDTQYGQSVDEDFVNALVKIPFPDLGNMLDVLEQVLLKLPLEALEAFSSIVPDWIVGTVTDVTEIVGMIISALDPRQIPLLLSQFLNLVGVGSLAAAEDFFAALLSLNPFEIINAILAALTGSTPTGPANDPLSLVFGLSNQLLSIPGNLIQLFFGQSATQQAQINALSSSGFIYDPASNGVTGWTNLTGTLAVSSRGSFIQATSATVAYRASGLTTDKYGVHFVVNPTMQGSARIGLCSTATASNYAALEVYRGFDGDALRIVTGASPTLAVAQKQADFIGVNRLGQTSLDIKTDGVNKFTVVRDGQPIPALDWTDSGGIVTHGASNRGVLLASNGFDRNEDSFYGPAISKVVSYAW